ncbi:MAG TPA: hypothetical protein VHE11_08190, partial [Steroidobacteraceae bacterium]|nr:hypothetical protein [Steroidobacteraceae bacterium]
SGANGQRNSGRQQQAGGGGIPRGAGGPQTAGAQSGGDSREAPGQAQRDAAMAAALARRQQGGAGNTGQPRDAQRNGADGQKGSDGRDLLAGGTRTPRQKPETEQQLALDQWLRQIPDSPAGLLRRKFLIEHMMKQQGGGDSEESGQ